MSYFASQHEMSGKLKLSGAQGRKRKAKEETEAKKLRKTLAAFMTVKTRQKEDDECDDENSEPLVPMSTTAAEEKYELESESMHSSDNDSEEEQTVNKAAASSVEGDHPALFHKSSNSNTNNEKINEDEQAVNPVVAAGTAEDHPVLVNKDVGFIDFSATGQASIVQLLKEAMVRLGSDCFQNADANFAKEEFGSKAIVRGMTQNWFVKQMKNGIDVPRTWLMYSPRKEAAFCFCCLLFPSSPLNCRSSFELEGGFTSWKKVEKLKNHEENSYHRQSFVEWKEMERRMKMHGVDDVLCSQIEAEKDRWREVLKRVLEVIKLLSTQNLALRGHVETLDVANPGNFLAVLKLLSKYDPVMANHFAFVRQNPRCVSYLSHDIQNEFIALLATAVRGKILDEIREAKYFGILFDSTPDISHTEQLSEVIRYVRLDYEAGQMEVREAFIDFLELEKKGAAGYEEIILKKLAKG